MRIAGLVVHGQGIATDIEVTRRWGAAVRGMRAYILPATGSTTRRRGLDAVLRLAEV